MPSLDLKRRTRAAATRARGAPTWVWEKRRPPAPPAGHTPWLWHFAVTAFLALLAAGAVAGSLYLWLRHAAPLVETYTVDGKKRYQINGLDLVKATITASGFIGAVLAGVYGYRKQRISEGDARRADADQFSNRYSKAAEQLGHDKAAVRLAGVYATARLADDWPDQRQVCIDVLCAYLRMPYDPDPESPKHRDGEKEVRHTIIRVIRDHLADPPLNRSWKGHNFDFTGTVFDGGSFANAEFSDGTVDFTRAEFSGGTVDFTEAQFSGGTVHFTRAEFSGGTVHFIGAEFFGGLVDFTRAEFSGGTVDFTGAKFFGGTVVFAEAQFFGGTVDFTWAQFSDGIVVFTVAQFSGGTIVFTKAKFSGGTVDFTRARFSGGTVGFAGAEFSGGTVDWGPFPALP